MDERDPITGQIVIEGERLRDERLAADEPFPHTPWEIGKAMAVIAILGLVWFVLCAFQMEVSV